MKHICCIILCFCTSIGSFAQNFADYFQNKTLRVDYIFTGDATQQAVWDREEERYSQILWLFLWLRLLTAILEIKKRMKFGRYTVYWQGLSQ